MYLPSTVPLVEAFGSPPLRFQGPVELVAVASANLAETRQLLERLSR
jgi:hypothetical protein